MRLFAQHREIEHRALAIDKQQRQIGRPQRIRQSLECNEVWNGLAVQFQNHVTGLES